MSMGITFPNLDKTLPNMIKTDRGNLWMKFGHAEVYIRIGPRWINNQVNQCVQIANILTPSNFEKTGNFTRMIMKIRTITDLPLYLENCRVDFSNSLVANYGWTLIKEYEIGGKVFQTDLLMIGDGKRIK
jgi:hypothetical protein